VTTRPPQRGTRAALPAWFALFLGLTLTVVVAGPAGAQPTSEDADLRMVVSSLTGVLGPYSVPRTEDDPLAPPDPPLDLELRLLIENAGPEPLDSLRVVIELYPATATRADLTAAFEGSPAGQPKVHEVAVRDGGSLAPGDIAGVADAFPYDDVDVWSEDGGVHPLRIAVVRGTDVLAQTMSAVVWIASPIESPLLSTFVWPYDDAPWRTVRGAYVPDADRSIQPGGRLDTLLRTLERRPDAPVTLAPAAHLLEDLRDRADGFTVFERQADGSVERRELQPEDPQARLANDVLLRVREVAQQLPHAPVTGAYADADLVALTAVAQTQLAGEAAVEGRRRLQQLLDRAPDAGTHLVGGHLDQTVLDLLPGDQLLLPAETVDAGDSTGPGRDLRPLRSASGRLLTGIVADRRISEAFAAAPGSAGPVADAQRIVAETAASYFSHRSVPDRTLLLLPPDTWAPNAEYVIRLLDALSEAPWMELTSPDVLATNGFRSSEPLELAPPTGAPLSTTLAEALDDTDRALEAARAAVTVDAPLIGGRSPRELHDTLLRASSRWHQGPGAGEAEALVRDVRRAVDETFGDVVVASGTRITLTSDTGQIPVTLQRTRGGPITVRVEVASQGRLVWPDGRRSEPLELTDGVSQTVSFRTRALSTGTFPVTVRVTDPTGEHELERTILSVRSTAISGPALSATGMAVLALLLAGALRRRRPKKQHLEVVD
jgi:hypothetical protein